MKRISAISLVLVVLAMPCGSSAQSTTSAAAAPKQGPPLATVDGQIINEDEVLSMVQGQLRPLREQEYQIKKKALESLIGQKVLEAEAKKNGLSVEKLFEREVDAKIADPSDAELNAIYAVQRDQLNNQPFEAVKPQLQQNLKRARIQQARQEYSTRLREQAKISTMLSPPRVQVGFDPSRVRGNPKAKVMIVEFSDFQCPYCGQVEATLKSVLLRHPDTVALAFRDMPIAQIHPLAQGAAEASRCAGEQGKFWEYHDLLFGDQANLDRNGLVAKAAKLQLDSKQFESCFASAKYRAQVQQDNQEGMLAGVNGTPGFFINGVFISGAQPEATFEKMIEDELAAAGRPKG